MENKNWLVEDKVRKTVVIVVARSSERFGDNIACKGFGKLERLLSTKSYVYRFLNYQKTRLGKGCNK